MTTLQILPHTETDLTIPPITAIRDRASEQRADALRIQDKPTADQLDNLIKALKRNIRMAWNYGDLLVSSASTPGTVYTVSCGVCNCPARKPCKHLKLAEVLIDMLDTLAESADIEADVDDWEFAAAMTDHDPPFEDNPLGGDEGDDVPARSIGRRLAEARAHYAYC